MKNTINNMRRTLATSLFIFISLLSYSQIRIEGTIKDSKGEAVIGAAVAIKNNSSVGTVSNLDGKYVLNIPATEKNPVVVVSSIGFEAVTAAVQSSGEMNFTLNVDAELLDEVVVVGYGFMKKSDLTGSVTSVAIDENTASRSSSLTGLLQGQAAGVQVLDNSGAPDAGVSIRVRGVSTFNGSSEPLYVVDGIIINNSPMTSTLLSQGDSAGSDEETNGLLGLNPQDIESIEILKDASATAIYGAQGANGVVLITTKTAKREKPSITFRTGFDYSTVSRRMDVLDFNEFVQYLTDIKDITSAGDYYLNLIYEDVANRTGMKVTPIDWQKHSFRGAFSQRYYFSVQGKAANTAYTFSLGYTNKKGIVKTTGVEQYSGRLNLDKTFGKKFKIGTKMNLAYISSDLTQGTGSGTMTAGSSFMRSIQSSRPYISNSSLGDDYDDDDAIDATLKAGPDRWLNRIHFANYRKEYRFTPSLYAQYRIAPWLTFRSVAGGDYRDSEREKFKSSRINTSNEGSNGAAGTYKQLYWNWDNMLMFNKKFNGKHNVSGTLGMTTQRSSTSEHIIEGWNIIEYKSNVESINSAPNTRTVYRESESATQSFFVRGIYNYMDRYVLTATYRIDGSSRFQGANKWASFPSFAGAWNIHREPWFKVPVISTAKLRLGWGLVGNQAISNYRTLSNYANTTAPTHEPGNAAEYSVGLYPSNLANPNLKWETNEQVNAGLDLGLAAGRVTFSVDAYLKNTYDLLQEKLIPQSSGFKTTYVNEGNIQNKGLEFTLQAVPVSTGSIEWKLNGNLSLNRNKIVKISEDAAAQSVFVETPRSNDPDEIERCRKDVIYFMGGNIGGGNYIKYPGNIYMEGYPMGLFYGFRVKNIVGVGDTGTPLSDGGAVRPEGSINYYDCNGNGYIDDDDRTIIGNPNPDFTYGFGTSLTYKRFTLNVNFNGSYGNDIINMNDACLTETSSSKANVYREAYYNAWTPSNTNTRYPALGMINASDYNKLSDLYVHDASYLRLASVSLGYDIPFKKARVFKMISINAAVNNVYVWTKYNGWDPNVNSFGTNVKKMGCDLGAYPSSRTFSLDVKFTF